MITPIIHRVLTREDLARLVAEIGRVDQAEARAAEEAVQAGEEDAALDSPAAVGAGRRRGGGPPPGPPPIPWVAPGRAAPPAPRGAALALPDHPPTRPPVVASRRP